jgi:hypothetical protein
MRSVHTLASVHVHWGATSLPCLARGTPGRFNCILFPSRLHFPVPLGSTVITRFLATTGTLTPVPLVLAQNRSPWFTHLNFWIFRLQPPHALLSRHCFGSGRLGQRFALAAIVSSSDFAHHMQAHQSHQAESSLCRRVQGTRLFYGLSLHFQLLSTRHCWLAVTFGYWQEAPPERDSHPPVQVRSQAHTCHS